MFILSVNLGSLNLSKFIARVSIGFYLSRHTVNTSAVNISPSAETRNLRPNTHFRGTNETEFKLIFDYSGL